MLLWLVRFLYDKLFRPQPDSHNLDQIEEEKEEEENTVGREEEVKTKTGKTGETEERAEPIKTKVGRGLLCCSPRLCGLIAPHDGTEGPGFITLAPIEMQEEEHLDCDGILYVEHDIVNNGNTYIYIKHHVTGGAHIVYGYSYVVGRGLAGRPGLTIDSRYPEVFRD